MNYDDSGCKWSDMGCGHGARAKMLSFAMKRTVPMLQQRLTADQRFFFQKRGVSTGTL